MSDKDLTQPPAGEFIMFASGDGRVRVECRFESDTIWLSQAAMAELYDKDVRTINEHLINIFSEGELVQNSTIRKFRIVRQEGKRQVSREIDHYNLEAILAVGYRVRSPRGTQFRQWATQTLQEYLIKGFVMDDERLKNPPVGSSVVPDYFAELKGMALATIVGIGLSLIFKLISMLRPEEVVLDAEDADITDK